MNNRYKPVDFDILIGKTSTKIKGAEAESVVKASL